MQKTKKIIIITACLFLITGCTKTLKDADKNVVKNENTGQSITENIICKPKDKEVISIYKENDVEISKLPDCEDFTPLAKEVRTAMGAEAKYQLAYCYFLLGSMDMAEQEVMSFTKMQTTQQYWLAKSMILLADINVQRNDTFQAKQYLLALKANYRQKDDIQDIIMQKLAQLEEQGATSSTNEEVQL